MSEFGDYLKKKRESREISQVNLSRLLKQKGFGISNSTISYWETGSRLPRDTNRNDLIEIGNILRMTLVEKDKLLRLVNLAPVSEGNEGEILDIAEITVTYQVDMDYNEYEKDRGGWWLKILYYRM